MKKRRYIFKSRLLFRKGKFGTLIINPFPSYCEQLFAHVVRVLWLHFVSLLPDAGDPVVLLMSYY